MEGTQLVFRTVKGGALLNTGTSSKLTKEHPNGLNISPYTRIRVALCNRSISKSKVTYLIKIYEDDDLTIKLDSITLSPGESFTNAYDVPGISLSLDAQCDSSSNLDDTDVVDVFIYGYIPYIYKEKELYYH